MGDIKLGDEGLFAAYQDRFEASTQTIGIDNYNVPELSSELIVHATYCQPPISKQK